MKRLWLLLLLSTLFLVACRPLTVNIDRRLDQVGAESLSPTAAMPAPAPFAAPELAIYLAEGTVKPSDLLPGEGAEDEAALSPAAVPLQPSPLLTMEDIVAYSASTHAFTLTVEATERLAALEVPVAGPVFVLSVDQVPVYAGAFWTPASSLSFDGVVIMLMPDGTPAFGSYRIELGYPGPDFFRGDDPRGDPRVLDTLRQAGKLVP